jgi:uncharacterized membrane protein
VISTRPPGSAPRQPGSQRGSPPRSLWRLLIARRGVLEYDRVVFLSDAIFAIAITLLVLDFHIPAPPTSGHVAAQLTDRLQGESGHLVGYLISLVVISQYWIGHHDMFRHIEGIDRVLAFLNLAFLASVAFLPFPTSVIGSYGATSPAVIFYAAAMTVVGGAQLAVWIYAAKLRHPALRPIPASVSRVYTILIARAPAVFLVSIPVALASPVAAMATWALIPLPGVLLRRHKRLILAELEPAGPPPSARPRYRRPAAMRRRRQPRRAAL